IVAKPPFGCLFENSPIAAVYSTPDCSIEPGPFYLPTRVIAHVKTRVRDASHESSSLAQDPRACLYCTFSVPHVIKSHVGKNDVETRIGQRAQVRRVRDLVGDAERVALLTFDAHSYYGP